MINRDSSIIKSSTNQDLSKYSYLTKEYPVIRFKKNQTIKKKIKYNNPDDYDKPITVVSKDPIIKLRQKQMTIEYKSSKYIKFLFELPMTEGNYHPSIVITNDRTGEIEEILKFNIEIIGDHEIP